MVCNVGLCGFAGVMLRVGMMAVRQVGVMGGLLVASSLVMLGGFLVVVTGQVMVMCGLSVMLRCFLGHRCTPLKFVWAMHYRLAEYAELRLALGFALIN